MNKSIAILIYSKLPTGGLKVLFKVGNGLLKRGYNVTYYVSEEESAFKLQYENNCKLIYSSQKVANRLFSRFAALMKIKLEADFVIATYFPTAVAAYFNKDINGKLLYYVQADETRFFSFRIITLLRRLHYYLFVKLSYLLPIEKIVNCEGSKDPLSKTGEYKIIPPGIDPEIYFPRPRNNRVLKIGHISRLEKLKGSTEFFIAMKELREEGVNFDLLIAYDFCKHTQGLDYETVSPKNEQELAEFYASCDIVVSTVWGKGFPYPPLETMACGSLSIATPIDYGKDGFDHLTIEENNPQSIKDVINWVISNPLEANKIRENGILTAKDYHWDRIIDQWETVFKQ